MTMTLKRLREKAHELYHGGECQIFWLSTETPPMLRHEDPILNGSGTWVTVPIFIPDDPPPRRP